MATVYVVTGATGFLGNNIVRELVKRGEKVRAYIRSPKKAQRVFKDVGVELFYGDICDKQMFMNVFDDKNEFVVIHAAAIVSIGKNDRNIDRVNIKGVMNVLQICKQINLKRLVFISSVHAIAEQPKKQLISETNVFDANLVVGKYAKTKAESTALVYDAIKKGLNGVIIHPSGVSGPNDYSNSYLTKMILDYKNGKIPVAVKGGYDFVDVRDVADAIIAVCDTQKVASKNCYLITNEYYSVKQILLYLAQEFDRKPVKLTMPVFVAKLALPFLTLYCKLKKTEPLYTAYSLYTLKSNSNFSHKKATRHLGYKPRPIEQCLKDTIEFLKQENMLN